MVNVGAGDEVRLRGTRDELDAELEGISRRCWKRSDLYGQTPLAFLITQDRVGTDLTGPSVCIFNDQRLLHPSHPL